MKIVLPALLLFAFPALAYAHCPLCTAGAGALAVFAAYIGVSTIVVGVCIGAFSLALGLWISRLIKKKYFKGQDIVVAMVVFLTTVVPVMPLIREYRPLYISLTREYGTLLHNTYTINLYIAGVIIGAAILMSAPHISRLVSKLRNGKKIPYQGITITFALLIVVSTIFQLLV